MKKNLWIPILLLLFILPSTVEGQRWKLRRYEASLGVGSTHAFADIGKEPDFIKSFQLFGTRPDITGSFRFKITQPLSVGLDFSYIMLSGEHYEEQSMPADIYISNSFEQALTIQYSITSPGSALGTNALFNRRGMVNNYNSSDLYLFTGVGGLKSWVKGVNYNYPDETGIGRGFNTKPPYALVIPVGIGLKYSIDAYWSFGVEVGGRFTFSDEIDGFDPENLGIADAGNDRYILTSFKAIYKVRNDRRGRPIFSSFGK